MAVCAICADHCQQIMRLSGRGAREFVVMVRCLLCSSKAQTGRSRVRCFLRPRSWPQRRITSCEVKSLSNRTDKSIFLPDDIYSNFCVQIGAAAYYAHRLTGSEQRTPSSLAPPPNRLAHETRKARLHPKRSPQ